MLVTPLLRGLTTPCRLYKCIQLSVTIYASCDKYLVNTVDPVICLFQLCEVVFAVCLFALKPAECVHASIGSSSCSLSLSLLESSMEHANGVVRPQLQQKCFSESGPDGAVYFQIVNLRRQLYVWLSAGSTQLGNLSMATQTRMVRVFDAQTTREKPLTRQLAVGQSSICRQFEP